MKLIHKLRLLGIGCAFALLCYLVFALFTGSFHISAGGYLVLAGLAVAGSVGVALLAVSNFLNRHSGKPGKTPGQGWRSQRTLKNGVQVLVSKEGHGRKVQRGRPVVLHYCAYHTEVSRATLFDTTTGKAPVELVFGTKHRLGGWTDGLEFLKAGAKVRLIVPPELGLGAKGAGDRVPANATLIFDVEVVEVKYNN